MPIRRKQMPLWKTIKAQRMRRHPTAAEAVLWQYLRQRDRIRPTGLRWRRQTPMYGYIADFYCASAACIVELDGEIHDQQAEYDTKRDQHLQAHGIATLRIANADVLADPVAVTTLITAFTQARLHRVATSP